MHRFSAPIRGGGSRKIDIFRHKSPSIPVLQEHQVSRDKVRRPRYEKKGIELPSDSGMMSADPS